MICEIFFPDGIVWQIWSDAIRTRNAAGRVIMRRRHFGGGWHGWFIAARNISTAREGLWQAGTQQKEAA
jgi:hypothetical protein